MNQHDAKNLLLGNWSKERENLYYSLLQSIEHIYQEVVELNLSTEMVYVLRNCTYPEQEGGTYSYKFEADKFCNYTIMEEDSEAAKRILDIESLRQSYKEGIKSNTVELRLCARDVEYEWVELCTFAIPLEENGSPKILITVRNINSQKLMKGIIERFIYDTCDYFIYLDARNDRYVMFSESDSGTPLPPAAGNSYSTEIVRYARNYVVEEDQDYTIEQMKLPLVIEMLDKKGEHIFYTGVKDPVRGYTHKCIKYLYYDRKNQMILLIRTDVTDIYLEEKKKSDQLRKALKEARTDALTGLHNRMAFENAVTRLLADNQKVKAGVFFFIDIDNFKMINDQYGHDEGDRVLCCLSGKLKEITAESCIVGRLGGDEFVLFDPGMVCRQAARELGDRIVKIFKDSCNESISRTGITCSVGMAIYPEDGARYDDLAKKADTALYTSKRAGKKQFCFFVEKEDQAEVINNPDTL